ncbi:MAG: glyoxylase-like metal-dependent hydrolase (beta-lactamase superfamily II) [Verrucomicrobiales bacterium]|jgi:glyoxylase-like metal-dependent hydrolase (beta-lactamase superfamily II)
MGGQRLIAAPDGLILVEAHAGLSFEAEWAAIQRLGFDPMQVKFVLATHEHGDHSPGAYLWRVVTGAKFVCSEEMAYHLQHHLPLGTGYGFHPPNLAGMKIRAVRLPGHTAGSMGWQFEMKGKTYLCSGDLIMPSGTLGYAGSVNFSARDALASLRKIEALRPDSILPGHGPHGDPAPYLAGIQTARATGWARMPPEAPDPYFNISEREHYRVVGWNQGAVSAAVGDLDGDQQPDIAIVTNPREGMPMVRAFLNRGGSFPTVASLEIPLPSLTPIRILIEDLNDDGLGDLIVTGESIDRGPDGPRGRRAERSETQIRQFLSQDGQFRQTPGTFVAPANVIGVRRGDLDGDGNRDLLLRSAHGGVHRVKTTADGSSVEEGVPRFRRAPYPDIFLNDFNGDGRNDLVSSIGELFLRDADGVLPAEPTLVLPAPGTEWTYATTGDFNGDGHADFVMMTNDGESRSPKAAVFLNTLDTANPFSNKPSTTFPFPLRSWQNTVARYDLQRASLVAADWNRDGIDDLPFAGGQGDQAVILLGGNSGLSESSQETIRLDFMLHYEHGLVVADFNADGVPDLACFGNTLAAGVGGSKDGPTAMFVRLQEP